MFNNDELITFGELTPEEQNTLFQAWLKDRKCIQLYNEYNWIIIPSPAWDSSYAYRIKPTKSSINWDHVSSEYNWMATEKTGKTYLYKSQTAPKIGNDTWYSPEGVWVEAKLFASFKPGKCNWKDSLVERPKV